MIDHVLPVNESGVIDAQTCMLCGSQTVSEFSCTFVKCDNCDHILTLVCDECINSGNMERFKKGMENACKQP